ncbi:hypothetical protein PF005_g22250 [Phytophthora fragariae]|uniref:Laminin EGF-like domain-containing protein n=1 Tax=Phytophthora fragariae TaxID=53985 RepID=A0A6A3S136_9STRA|nr:hypothetical protein PF009_g23056 [Phytophthora fragariae]KAE8984213.1 hypothetical protein PF011_g20864 [Phytophthora fragariae]KAE9082619.1 hypothetical protein PF007_g22223 [Phytophthora fragariae]KAE9082652.1 hypothetical protein PF010_g21502 [Phytophthora fragariae]KAE9106856.1 hypothetical protein PF006_g21259 [Phytophthora fragariae]
MRSRFIFTVLLASAAALTLLLPSAEAAACAGICYTTVLTGFGPGGVPGCTCSGSQAGARTGAGGCNCGQCYANTNGAVYGFAINANGTCTYGTDCGSCDYTPTNSKSSSSSSGSRSTTSQAPATSGSPSTDLSSSASTSLTTDSSSSLAPASATSSSSSSSSSTPSSNSRSSAYDNASGSSDSREGGGACVPHLSTWQIVLAICCSVLFFAVAVVSVCSCYCKARSRLYEHEQDLANYFNQNVHQAFVFQPWVANRTPRPQLQATKSSNIV